MKDFEKAEYWYKRCTELDPERVDCPAFLARLYLDHGRTEAAWDQCVSALSSTYPPRAFGNNFYIYDCFAPIEGAKTLLKRLEVSLSSSSCMTGLRAHAPSLRTGGGLQEELACAQLALDDICDGQVRPGYYTGQG
jgi:hypothetical protein